MTTRDVFKNFFGMICLISTFAAICVAIGSAIGVAIGPAILGDKFANYFTNDYLWLAFLLACFSLITLGYVVFCREEIWVQKRLRALQKNDNTTFSITYATLFIGVCLVTTIFLSFTYLPEIDEPIIGLLRFILGCSGFCLIIFSSGVLAINKSMLRKYSTPSDKCDVNAPLAKKLSELLDKCDVNALSAEKLSKLLDKCDVDALSAEKLSKLLDKCDVDALSAKKLSELLDKCDVNALSAEKLSELLDKCDVNASLAKKLSDLDGYQKCMVNNTRNYIRKMLDCELSKDCKSSKETIRITVASQNWHGGYLHIDILCQTLEKYPTRDEYSTPDNEKDKADRERGKKLYFERRYRVEVDPKDCRIISLHLEKSRQRPE